MRGWLGGWLISRIIQGHSVYYLLRLTIPMEIGGPLIVVRPARWSPGIGKTSEDASPPLRHHIKTGKNLIVRRIPSTSSLRFNVSPATLFCLRHPVRGILSRTKAEDLRFSTTWLANSACCEVWECVCACEPTREKEGPESIVVGSKSTLDLDAI